VRGRCLYTNERPLRIHSINSKDVSFSCTAEEKAGAERVTEVLCFLEANDFGFAKLDVSARTDATALAGEF
jgi:hypothetical protein